MFCFGGGGEEIIIPSIDRVVVENAITAARQLAVGSAMSVGSEGVEQDAIVALLGYPPRRVVVESRLGRAERIGVGVAGGVIDLAVTASMVDEAVGLAAAVAVFVVEVQEVFTKHATAATVDRSSGIYITHQARHCTRNNVPLPVFCE